LGVHLNARAHPDEDLRTQLATFDFRAAAVLDDVGRGVT
jgi:hypothetical protein